MVVVPIVGSASSRVDRAAGGGKNPRLHTDEVLVALSVLSKDDEQCRMALEQLPNLRGCQVHSTVMLSEVDRKIFKKLGCGLTCDPIRKK